MVWVRSVIFNVLFYMMFIAEMIIFTPIYFILPRKKAYFVPKFWARSNLWLMKLIVGTDVRIEGLENLPKGPSSSRPNTKLLGYIRLPAAYRRSALYPEARASLDTRLRLVCRQAAHDRHRPFRSRQGHGGGHDPNAQGNEDRRQLIIYPEGTRRPPGAEPVYKFGIARSIATSTCRSFPSSTRPYLLAAPVRAAPGWRHHRAHPAADPARHGREGILRASGEDDGGGKRPVPLGHRRGQSSPDPAGDGEEAAGGLKDSNGPCTRIGNGQHAFEPVIPMPSSRIWSPYCAHSQDCRRCANGGRNDSRRFLRA